MNNGYWVRCNSIFFKVEGRPVHVCEGIEAFAHRPLVELHKAVYETSKHAWEISDARTGLAFGARAKTIRGAVELAREKLERASTLYGGVNGWRSLLEGYAVTPRYYEEYYDARTAPVPLEEAKVVM